MRIQYHLTGRRAPTVSPLPSNGRTRMAALLVSGVAVLLAACSSSSSSTTTSTVAPTSAPTTTAPTTSTTSGPGITATSSGSKTSGCSTSNLAISLGSPSGTAGAIHYVLTYRNVGTSPCTLFGYPGVSFLDAGGRQIGSPAQRTAGIGATSVSLALGGNAYSSVLVSDPGIPPCSSSAIATRVQVFPPGETHAALVAAPSAIAVCSSPNTPSFLAAIIGPLVSSTP